MSTKIAYHVTPTRNFESIMKHGLIPQIGDNSKLIGETEPAVYFFASGVDAENALMNWLGDLYEDIDLLIFEVDLSNYHTSQLPDQFEITCQKTIDPNDIKSTTAI